MPMNEDKELKGTFSEVSLDGQAYNKDWDLTIIKEEGE